MLGEIKCGFYLMNNELRKRLLRNIRILHERHERFGNQCGRVGSGSFLKGLNNLQYMQDAVYSGTIMPHSLNGLWKRPKPQLENNSTICSCRRQRTDL